MLKKLEEFGQKNTNLIRTDVEEEDQEDDQDEQEDEAVETHSSKSTRYIKVGLLLMHTLRHSLPSLRPKLICVSALLNGLGLPV